jgi:putative transposase
MLISLGSEQSVSKIVQLLKGESSRWVNEQHIVKNRFEWQNDYYATAVSESLIGKVREYIHNQEEHHREKSFAEEYNEFKNRYGFTQLKN